MKQVIVVNRALALPKGKLAAQAVQLIVSCTLILSSGE
jgi:peptidyl-tRNA hydrolase